LSSEAPEEEACVLLQIPPPLAALEEEEDVDSQGEEGQARLDVEPPPQRGAEGGYHPRHPVPDPRGHGDDQEDDPRQGVVVGQVVEIVLEDRRDQAFEEPVVHGDEPHGEEGDVEVDRYGVDDAHGHGSAFRPGIIKSFLFTVLSLLRLMFRGSCYIRG